MFRLKTLGIFFLILIGSWFQGCTCCAYLNHMFNAERAYDEAAELRETRLDTIPEDSLTLPQGEELKKYDRVIEKGSRVLERFPENERQTANAIFLIGESFRHKGEWAQAITKYDEFERYFSSHDSMPTVEYQRAYCLYRNGEYNISRFALESVLNPNHPYYYEGLNLLSLLEEKSEMPGEAILALEKMLQDSSGTPYIRGKAHFRLAGLYFNLEKWEKARNHFQAPEIQELSPQNRYTAAVYSAECEFNLKHYGIAEKEYAVLISNKEFENYLPELIVRRGEILLHDHNWTEGERSFHLVNRDYPKTESSARSYYNLGDFYQTEKRKYPEALTFYDSSSIAMPNSSWGKNSRDRRDALRKLLELQQKNAEAVKDSTPENKLFFENEFQISELFLFRLSELDSSLNRLDRIIHEAKDSTLILRATYARAFIYDEFKNSPADAENLYREIIEKYPGTEYAKQAQINLGMRVTVKTNEDIAHEAFLRAESLWVYATSIPLESMDLVDSAYENALIAYDSVYRQFPKTSSGIQALFMKASLYSMDPERQDSAIAAFIILRNQYAQTLWGKEAAYRLHSKNTITDDELKRLKNRVVQNEAYVDRLSKQYYESFKPVKKEPEVQERKSPEDEILENTYNSMYDFE